MSDFGDFIFTGTGGGDIPVGDQFRIGANVSVGTSDTTILSVSPTNGGVLWGLFIDSATASRNIDEIKVTVDGEPERTFADNIGLYTSGGGQGFLFSMPIKFDTSLTVKAKLLANSETMRAIYSEQV